MHSAGGGGGAAGPLAARLGSLFCEQGTSIAQDKRSQGRSGRFLCKGQHAHSLLHQSRHRISRQTQRLSRIQNSWCSLGGCREVSAQQLPRDICDIHTGEQLGQSCKEPHLHSTGEHRQVQLQGSDEGRGSQEHWLAAQTGHKARCRARGFVSWGQVQCGCVDGCLQQGSLGCRPPQQHSAQGGLHAGHAAHSHAFLLQCPPEHAHEGVPTSQHVRPF